MACGNQAKECASSQQGIATLPCTISLTNEAKRPGQKRKKFLEISPEILFIRSSLKICRSGRGTAIQRFDPEESGSHQLRLGNSAPRIQNHATQPREYCTCETIARKNGKVLVAELFLFFQFGKCVSKVLSDQRKDLGGTKVVEFEIGGAVL